MRPIPWDTQAFGCALLTRELLPLLKATPGSRVVYTSSGGMYNGKFPGVAACVDPEAYDGQRAAASLASTCAEGAGAASTRVEGDAAASTRVKGDAATASTRVEGAVPGHARP